MPPQTTLSRRQFLVTSATAAVGTTLLDSCQTAPQPEPIIDIHQHCNYGGKRDAQWRQISPARNDDELITHQQNMGVTQTILLPSGKPVNRASTHNGQSNGLESTCAGVEECAALARRFPGKFYFSSNEVPDLDGAPQVIEQYLKAGAVCIAEQKFGVECDSPEMQAIYEVAAHYRVPILLHVQFQMYNYGYDRFYKMFQKHPHTIFVGHAQTVWAHIDKNYIDNPGNLYPRGKVTPGGWTDRYLSDYSNFFADLSADSGYNAFTRDRDFTRGFFERHQDKLMYGSDCLDKAGQGDSCPGSKTIQIVRELSGSKEVERKLLYKNARRIYRV